MDLLYVAPCQNIPSQVKHWKERNGVCFTWFLYLQFSWHCPLFAGLVLWPLSKLAPATSLARLAFLKYVILARGCASPSCGLSPSQVPRPTCWWKWPCLGRTAQTIFHWKARGERNWGGARSKHLHFLSSKTQTEHEKLRLDGEETRISNTSSTCQSCNSKCEIWRLQHLRSWTPHDHANSSFTWISNSWQYKQTVASLWTTTSQFLVYWNCDVAHFNTEQSIPSLLRAKNNDDLKKY